MVLDRKLLETIAKQSGFSETDIQHAERQNPVLHSMFSLFHDSESAEPHEVFRFIRRAVRHFAQNGNLIIVGRLSHNRGVKGHRAIGRAGLQAIVQVKDHMVLFAEETNGVVLLDTPPVSGERKSIKRLKNKTDRCVLAGLRLKQFTTLR